MEWMETLKRAGKTVSSKIAEKYVDERVLNLLKINLNQDLVKNRELFIPEAMLEKEIGDLVSEQGKKVNAALTSLTCREDRIEIALSVNKMGVGSNVLMTLRIREFEIGRHRQVAVCHVSDEKLIGNTLLGMIGTGIINFTVNDIVKAVISMKDISDIATFSAQTRLITVDLSRLEPVRKLMKPYGSTNISLTDIIRIRAAHKTGGMAVSAELVPEFKAKIEPKKLLEGVVKG